MKQQGRRRAAFAATLLFMLVGAACAAPEGPPAAQAAPVPRVDTAVARTAPEGLTAVAGPAPLEALPAEAPSSNVAPSVAAPPPTPPVESTATSSAVATAPPAVVPASRAAIEARPASQPGRPSLVVSRGRTDRQAVALTFDAGADRGHAERILDELAKQHVTAAFGITGEWAEANRDLVARAHREGHALINHSYDHSSFTGFSWAVVARTPAERASQLARTERVLGEIAGASAQPYFRPPFGDLDPGVLADVGAAGYDYTVMWTVDSMGWRGWDAARITQRCLDGAAPGAIYIFHVGAASADADALRAVIEGLRARSFEIGSLADVIGSASP